MLLNPLILRNAFSQQSKNVISTLKTLKMSIGSIHYFQTDTLGSWGIGEKSLPKDTPLKEVEALAIQLKAHVIVKPKNGKWYLKGFNGKKTYHTIRAHLEENERNGYHPNTKTILIKYCDMQPHLSWASS
jgi:hypothetical protein